MATVIFHPVQEQRRNTIAEPVVLAAYEVYCAIYGAQPAMVDVAAGCRGGFSWGELTAFLYAKQFPRSEWAARVDEAFERRREG